LTGLKKIRPILFIALVSLWPVSTFAQEFYSSLNNYNRILVNPSYAGFGYESNISTSWSVFAKSKDELFNEYTFVYDCYSPKLKAGTAFYLKQGLQGDVNTNTIEFGYSFTPRINRFKGVFFPSVYVGYQKPLKQWFVYGFDEWRNNFEYYQNTPGKAYLRSELYKIGGSLLFIFDKINFGVSGNYGWQIKADPKIVSSRLPYKIVAHLSTRMNRKSNGILSQTKQIRPQFILHLENGLFESKSEILVAGRNILYSIFLIDNFSDNLHNLGGSVGFENTSIRLVLAGGLGSNTNLDKLTFNSSLSLMLKLSKENIKQIFPFKPLN
jgi:hypothetical protein